MAKYEEQSNMLGAAMLGVAIGALGAAVFLWDDKRRNQIKRSVAELREKGEDKIDEVQREIDKTEGKLKRAVGRNGRRV